VTKLSCCFSICDRNSRCRFYIMGLPIFKWNVLSFIYTRHQELTLATRYLLMIYHSLFIVHISTLIIDGPSLSYMMLSSSCNTLLHNVGSFILIHVCFCHVFFTFHKHKKMVVFGHIVSQERKHIIYETWWILIQSMLMHVTSIRANDMYNK